jgi:hypothetical protein
VKYNVTEVVFKQALAALGGSAWFATAKQGGYESCEFDSSEGLLTLVPGKERPGIKKRRIHVSNTVDMVFGVTTAARGAGSQTTD